MKINLKRLSFFVGLCLGSMVYAHAQQVIDLSTGVWPGGAFMIFGSNEDTWKVQLPSGSIVTPKVCNPQGSWASSTCSRWITTNLDGSNNPTDDASSGDYRFSMQFPISNMCNAVSANVNFNKIGADNNVIGFELNGHAYSLGPANFNPLVTTGFALNTGHLLSGLNTVTVIVRNNGLTFMGLNICGSLTINYNGGNLTPTITGSSNFCAGVAPTFVGSDGSTSNALNYLWESVEADASGIPVPGVPNNYSNWFSGSPGNFAFPASAFTCGKFYRIKLAPTNSCTNWSEATKVIYITCPPVANAGVDKMICEDSQGCVTIGTAGSGKINYTWTYMSDGLSVSAGTTPQITVCPTTTTTYTLTSSNLAGCSNSDQVTVSILPNTPDFSLYVDNTPATYFKLTATPNDPTANSQPGFSYHWQIDEINPATNTNYYTMTGSSCWWNYPIANTFSGFTAIPASYNLSTSCGSSLPVGKFLYNRMYRISRATMNNSCSWNWFSVIVYPQKNGQVTIIENVKPPTNDPVMNPSQTELIGNNSNISEFENESIFEVYPNPSNGLYTLNTNLTEGVMDVYDMAGKRVFNKTLQGEPVITIDLSNYAKGMYVVNLQANGKKYSQKIILQ